MEKLKNSEGCFYLKDNHWVCYKSPRAIKEEVKNWWTVGCVYPTGKKSYFIDCNIDCNLYDSITVECEDGYFFAFLRKEEIKAIRKELLKEEV